MPNNSVDVITLKTKVDDSGLDDVTQALDALAKELGDTSDGLDETGKASVDAESKLAKVGTTAAGVVAGLATSALTQQALSVVTDFAGETLAWSDALEVLEGKTGLTGDAFEDLKESAFDLYSDNFGADVQDITNKLASAQQITQSMGDDLEAVTKGGALFEQMFGAGFEESVRASDQLMTQFGVSGAGAVDLIAYAYQQAGDPQQDLLDTINEYSSTFAESGYDAQQMFDALVQGSESGIFAFDKSADAVREFGIRTQDASQSTQDAYAALFKQTEDWVVMQDDGSKVVIDSYAELQTALKTGQIDLALTGDRVAESLMAIEDPLQRQAIAAALIGTQYEDLGDDIISVLDIKDEAGEATGAFDEMASHMRGGLGGAVERLKRSFTVGLFKAIEPVVVQFIDFLIPAIEDFSGVLTNDLIPAGAELASLYGGEIADALGDVSDAMEPFIDKIQEFMRDNPELMSALKEFGTVAGVLAAGVGIISVAIAALTPVVGAAAAGFALLTSPIAILIGLAAALYVAYTENFLGFGDAVDSAVSTLSGALEDVHAFIDGLIGAFNDNGIEGAGNFIDEKLIKPLTDSLSTYVESGQLLDDAKALGAAILTALDEGLDFASAGATFFLDNVVTPLSEQIWTYISGGQLMDDLTALGQALYSTLGVALDFATMGATFFFDNVVTPLSLQIWTYVSSGQIVDDLTAMAASWLTLLKAELDIATKAGTFILDNVITPLVDQIGAVNLADIEAGLTKIGKDALNALGDGFIAGAADVEAAFKGAINDAIPDHFGINIPSAEGFGVKIGGGSIGVDIPNPFPGFREGTPFTGWGDPNQPAGIVHNQEGVVQMEGAKVYPSPNGLMLEGTISGGGNGLLPVQLIVQLDSDVLYDAMHTVELRRAPR